jgi:hypothetical protein
VNSVLPIQGDTVGSGIFLELCGNHIPTPFHHPANRSDMQPKLRENKIERHWIRWILQRPTCLIGYITFSFLVTFTTDWDFHYEGFQMVFWAKGNSTQPPTTTTPTTTGHYVIQLPLSKLEFRDYFQKWIQRTFTIDPRLWQLQLYCLKCLHI